VRAGGLTGTAAAAGELAVRAPVGAAAGPGCWRVAVAVTPLAVALPAGLTRRVDGRGALRPARLRRALVTSSEPFVCVLRVSSATTRLFPTPPVMCS
jgi:hypothetical protein